MILAPCQTKLRGTTRFSICSLMVTVNSALVWLQRLTPKIRHGFECGLVCCFQRHGNVFLRRQEQRDAGQRLAHRDWLDKRLRRRSADVGRTYQRLAWIESKGVVV